MRRYADTIVYVKPVDAFSDPAGFYADQCLGCGYVPTALWPQAVVAAALKKIPSLRVLTVEVEEAAERLSVYFETLRQAAVEGRL